MSQCINNKLKKKGIEINSTENKIRIVNKQRNEMSILFLCVLFSFWWDLDTGRNTHTHTHTAAEDNGIARK